ncbi:WD40 repeat-like protein [Auriscalpium vulgare]|uniref:WD40 repeat-like protein n=1 Tax=Auriscalpium vulgare TaxID=40419 RepID=A0ACB8SBT4_9AGAM|nr:WD40 repeat-like protein [Auriscalpium vulgare]
MLAVATSGHLTLVDSSVLRRCPPSLPPTCETSSSAVVASTWSTDNTNLYVASADTITRFDSLGSLVKTVYESAEAETPAEPIGSLITKDRGSLIFSTGSHIHVLEHSASLNSPSKVVQTLLQHPDSLPVLALSLSNDGTLLAAASPHVVLVHNLSLNSHTVLRDLPLENDDVISACAFHPHSRVRLFVGIRRQLVVYDITRPSGPTRIISMSDAATGDIIAIACSPYSKTLLAVACSGGYVALIDLDKDPGRIRSFGYKVAVTSLVFSVDGASLYVGTETGKVLVQTLRSMEAPKSILVGGCVQALAIAKKTRLSVDSAAKTTGSISSKPLSPQDTNSPRRVSIGQMLSTSSIMTNGHAKLDAASSLKKSSSAGADDKPSKSPIFSKKIDTPLRKRVDSTTAVGSKKVAELKGLLEKKLERSDSVPVHVGTPQLMRSTGRTGRTKQEALAKDELHTNMDSPARPSISRPKASLRSSVTSAVLSRKGDKSFPRSRTTSTIGPQDAISSDEAATLLTATPQRPPRTRTVSAPKSPSSLASKNTNMATRTRTVSSTSRTGATHSKMASPPASGSTTSRSASALSRATSSASVRTSTARPRTTSSTSRATARERSPMPPVPRIPLADNLLPRNLMRTPSPDLPMPSPIREAAEPFPSIDETPQPKRKGLSMFGLSTPEVEKWIDGKDEGKKGSGKAVVFSEGKPDDDLGEVEKSRIEDLEEEMNGLRARESKQPRDRPLSMQLTPRRPTGGSWAPSPLRHSMAGNSPGTNGVQNLLHGLISDAMLDFQQDTKAEMVGMHLDLLRMGRAWRQEMRSAMGDFTTELRELREENRLLREENERLRRGY